MAISNIAKWCRIANRPAAAEFEMRLSLSLPRSSRLPSPPLTTNSTSLPCCCRCSRSCRLTVTEANALCTTEPRNAQKRTLNHSDLLLDGIFKFGVCRYFETHFMLSSGGRSCVVGRRLLLAGVVVVWIFSTSAWLAQDSLCAAGGCAETAPSAEGQALTPTFVGTQVVTRQLARQLFWPHSCEEEERQWVDCIIHRPWFVSI